MEQSKIGLLLKCVVAGCVVLAIGAYVIVAFPFYKPHILEFYPTIYQYYPYWFAAFAPSLILILIALKHAWVIVSNIGSDNSFCRDNADRFKKISNLATIYGAYIFIVEVIAFLIFTHKPFLFISSMVLTLVAGGIAVVCRVLAILIRKATDLQDEQELTI